MGCEGLKVSDNPTDNELVVRSLKLLSARIRREERGFTIIEALVAAFVLLVGIVAVLTIFDNASVMTRSNVAHQQGLALDREVIESVRALPFSDMTTAQVVTALRGTPAFDDRSGAGGWQVERRGVTYDVAVGVCDVDERLVDTTVSPVVVLDGYGKHAAGRFCANGTGHADAARCEALIGSPGSIQGMPAASTAGADAGDCGLDRNLDGGVDDLVQSAETACPEVKPSDCDTQPSDYKRVVVLVAWDFGGGHRYALQSATIAFPGLSTAPSVTKLVPRGLNVDPTNGSFKLTSAAGSTLTFDAETNRPAATLRWSLSGTDKGPAPGSGTAWTFDWPVGAINPSDITPATGEVPDGSYTVGAQASDNAGLHGQDYSVTIRINRR